MNLGKDEQRPKGKGMRRNQRRAASAPTCRRHVWLDGGWPIRQSLFGGIAGAPNAVRRGWAEWPIPRSQDTRAARTVWEKKQRAVGPLLHSSPRSAKLTTSLPATIR